MKIALINCSPKRKNSASGVILQGLKGYLLKGNPDSQIFEFHIQTRDVAKLDSEAILSCDALVFSMPLYVDGVPSHVVEALLAFETAAKAAAGGEADKAGDEMNKAGGEMNRADKLVYAIVNCGFHEGHQNAVALSIMKNWCARMNYRWRRGIGMGAGGMIGELNSVPMGQGPKKTLGTVLCEVAKELSEERTGALAQPQCIPHEKRRMQQEEPLESGQNGGLPDGRVCGQVRSRADSWGHGRTGRRIVGKAGAREEGQAGNRTGSQSGETRYITANFPRFLYRTAAQIGWRRQVKRSGLKTKDLFRRPKTLRTDAAGREEPRAQHEKQGPQKEQK